MAKALRSVVKADKKEPAKTRSAKNEPTKIIVEVVVKIDTTGVNPAAIGKNTWSAIQPTLRTMTAATEAGLADNFTFEITVPNGVRLTLIDIDGTRIEGNELKALGQAAVNGFIKGGKAVLIVIDTIFFEVRAVGEPNNEVSINLKHYGKDVFKKDQTFMIKSNRRGNFIDDNLKLP